MSKEINIIAKPTKDQVFNAGLGVLELKKAESFSYTLKIFDELEKSKPSRTNMHAGNKAFEKYNADLKKYEEAKKTLITNYENLSWAWQLVNNGVDPKHISHNASFSKGIGKMNTEGFTSIAFPKLLEGGGMVWLEAFDNTKFINAALGKNRQGVFLYVLWVHQRFYEQHGQIINTNQ